VKSWAEVIRDCENRLRFVQDTLRIEVSTEEVQDRIAKLKSSVLGAENMNLEEALDLPNTGPSAAGKPSKPPKLTGDSSQPNRP